MQAILHNNGGDKIFHPRYYFEMAYKCGSWGEKAKKRSQKRKKYFLEYQKNRRSQIAKKPFVPKGCIKRNARQRVRDHILAGKIIKPKKYAKCFEIKKIEAHHNDYSKPLDVVFLCKHCHVIADKEMKQ